MGGSFDDLISFGVFNVLETIESIAAIKVLRFKKNTFLNKELKVFLHVFLLDFLND